MKSKKIDLAIVEKKEFLFKRIELNRRKLKLSNERPINHA
jgi:hypothetical protein